MADAQREENPSPAAAAREYTLVLGCGTSHPGWGETETKVQTIDFIARLGFFLSREFGYGWLRGRHQFIIEMPLHFAIDPQTRIMTGGYLLGSWKFTKWKEARLYPYVLAGGGALFVDLGLPTMGSRLNFCYQGGGGLQYSIGDGLSLTAEYRYHHVSNAGTATPNEPLNSTKILLGIAYFR